MDTSGETGSRPTGAISLVTTSNRSSGSATNLDWVVGPNLNYTISRSMRNGTIVSQLGAQFGQIGDGASNSDFNSIGNLTLRNNFV